MLCCAIRGFVCCVSLFGVVVMRDASMCVCVVASCSDCVDSLLVVLCCVLYCVANEVLSYAMLCDVLIFQLLMLLAMVCVVWRVVPGCVVVLSVAGFILCCDVSLRAVVCRCACSFVRWCAVFAPFSVSCDQCCIGPRCVFFFVMWAGMSAFDCVYVLY